MENYNISFWIKKFIDYLKQQNKSQFTQIAYKKDLEQFSGFLISKEIIDVREIKKEDIDSFIKKLLSENYTKKSASRKLNSIRTFFRFLKNEGVINVNPALEVSHPKYNQPKPRVFSQLEYRAIRDVAKKDLRTYALVEILLQTGIKIGELANLKIQNINKDYIVVPTYGKTLARKVPLTPSLKKALNEYLKSRPQSESPYLFITRNHKPLLIRNIRQIIDRCFKHVGIENATVNDFRNTFIAYQLQKGVSIEYVAKIVGHKRLSSTERFLELVNPSSEKKEKIEEL
jgi:site-specific recombinase XerD